jgi:rhamnose transport system ATP-binding protein
MLKATPPALSLSGIAKSFGGVRALVGARLELFAGEVTALIGENGAGKSTLVKILTGIYQADDGVISLGGAETRIGSVAAAQALGISAMHQEPVIFDDLSVAENIFITNRPRKRGRIDWQAIHDGAREILRELDGSIDPAMPARLLGVAQKHVVQIARALSNDARIVIMDEPTAALSHREVEELFVIVGRLKRQGKAILFITHKFDEIFAVADRYAVFRDGAAVGAGLICDVDRSQLISMMVGRPVDQVFPKQIVPIGDEFFHVAKFSRKQEFADISFDLRRGEILGVYGLVGAGRSEVMQAIFGLTHAEHGTVTLRDRQIRIGSPGEAIAHGIAYVPEDRQIQGGVQKFSIGRNIELPSLGRLSRFGFVNRARAKALAEDYVRDLQIKTTGTAQGLQELSGGNQQKVIIAKWLATNPQVMIMDEPTKGIDVGAKTAVYRLMGDIVAKGMGIIMVSSELPEILGMADRILVMRHGRLRACFDRAAASPENIVRAATDA